MKIRDCKGAALKTGASACPYDRDNIVGAIVVAHGQKLPSSLDGAALEQACHADRPSRVMPIKVFVEYVKNGGEMQVAQNGYGPNQVTGMSALTDGFTTDKLNENLAASLSETANNPYDVYFYDKNTVIYGVDDGTDELAGIPMSSIYPTVTQFPSSGSKQSLVVNFCYEDARKSFEKFNYEQLNFNIATFAYGLTPVRLYKTAATKYKIVEAVGGYDRTAEFGAIIAAAPTSVFKGSVTGVTYDADAKVLTIAGDTAPELKAPSDLYTAGVKGIEGV